MEFRVSRRNTRKKHISRVCEEENFQTIINVMKKKELIRSKRDGEIGASMHFK